MQATTQETKNGIKALDITIGIHPLGSCIQGRFEVCEGWEKKAGCTLGSITYKGRLEKNWNKHKSYYILTAHIF